MRARKLCVPLRLNLVQHQVDELNAIITAAEEDLDLCSSDLAQARSDMDEDNVYFQEQMLKEKELELVAAREEASQAANEIIRQHQRKVDKVRKQMQDLAPGSAKNMVVKCTAEHDISFKDIVRTAHRMAANLSSEHKEVLLDLFHLMDTDQTGIIAIRQLQNLMISGGHCH